MIFTREEYKIKYELMYKKMLEQIDLFNEIIQDERDRIDRNDSSLEDNS
jgi:hypothetical protein